MPLVWVSRFQTVTFLVTSGSRSASSGTISTTGVSRANLPSSTSCMTTVAVHTLLTEPICQTESSVEGWPVPAWRTPVTAVTRSSGAPSRTQAQDAELGAGDAVLLHELGEARLPVGLVDGRGGGHEVSLTGWWVPGMAASSWRV